ncbi:hypothetical protein CASFOL_011294 [Castilleja foliolosa]|uniref:Nucleoporin Nup133/Nup155-like N-terminal domain-containing protein n=1 Tax=Castilleja foliolosa TaxID=1961234 RepID=A0ABD3DYW6_9LAMI
MFSPPTKKSSFSARKNVSIRRDDNSTPLAGNRSQQLDSPAVPNRPATGTPAPWTSRLSVRARVMPTKINDRDDVDAVHPVYVGEFPQELRDAQIVSSKNLVPADASISGGMDKETSLAWIICTNRLFIWNYLLPAASRKCTVIDLTSVTSEIGDVSSCLVRVVNWDTSKKIVNYAVQQYNSAGVILCNKYTGALVFWPDIYNANKISPLTCHGFSDKLGNNIAAKSCYVNSLIVSSVPGVSNSCIALACSSNGVLWRFLCSPSGVHLKRTERILSQESDVASKGYYPRSFIWLPFSNSSYSTTKQFFLLTDDEIQCFLVNLSSEFHVSKLWSHKIIGPDNDLGIQKGLAGQKKIWPLDLDVDSDGKVITILIAIFCKDRGTSSSYTEYSILTMQYKSGVDMAKPMGEQILEKKAPTQVIIPKARVENEDFLFSMRLKVGGKPAGSAVILSGDGTATVSHYWRNSTKLYQFDLPNDAGKVLDASIFPSLDESEDGAWVVLTEKAGVWAIPERAVLLGGVEPPERSLSRKGSSNDGFLQEERRNFSVSGNIAPRRAGSEVWDAGDRQRVGLTGAARRSPQDEESETLLSQLFHDFLLSGQVDGALDKLKNTRAFEREGEINVFARTSKSIVDTLAKHWTTTRGSEIALSVVSTQLAEKHQKHQKFLQFLALSKCHEELCSRQRQSMQIIMEHGEKLASMIELRELQNTISHATASGLGSSYDSDARTSGALWDLIQLVGERARRNTVLLMDRDNAEVFYTIHYTSEHHLWYPPPEGLTPWYSKAIVWSGLWSLASFMLPLLTEMNCLDDSLRFEFYSNLEVLSEMLLESHSNAITAKVERKEDHRGLLEEYWKCRDTLLDSLYKQVKKFVQRELQDSAVEREELNKDTLMTLSSKLLSIAKRHEGYQTMWSICCDLNDSELLQSLMHENIGPKGGFSCFVFKQLYESKQFSKLMRLGEEFHDELATFLKQYPDLLWLQELLLRQFSSASETLHILSLSKDDRSVPDIEEIEASGSRRNLTLANRKHFLNLAKISALAGKNDGYELKVRRIEADLNILQLQEEILRLLPDNEEKQSTGQNLLPPVDLIEMCLKIKNHDLSLRAFDLFSWTSMSFLRNNITLLKNCWRNAANQDDWQKLHRMSVNEGWSDERTSEIFKGTVLFQAGSKCYGPHTETFDVKFVEVLLLRQEEEESDSSVESVLREHRDFPEAGKLMIAAIVLGRCGSRQVMMVGQLNELRRGGRHFYGMR